MKGLVKPLLMASLSLAGGGEAAADQAAPEIWFFLRPYGAFHGVDGRQGWDRLAAPDAPWPDSMRHVRVVAVAGNFSAIPDDILAKVLPKLRQRHIGFAIESLGQSWVNQPKCGKGGYVDPGTVARVAQRIKAAGGELTYVTMDGPLWAGHYDNEPGACHSSIKNVAERAAALMREYQKVFPNVIFGDTEPLPSLMKQPGWQDSYREWMQAFREAVGQPIAFLDVDINWPQDNGNWRPSLENVARFTRTNHLPFGIIYNASFPAGAKSDQQWLDRATDNFTQIEEKMGIVPDKALFESWAYFPKRSITDQSGLGEDYLLEKYVRIHKGYMQ